MNTGKKTVRGMTLVEIIIAMFVFAVTAFILVQVGTTINSLAKQANHVNKKVSIEAPIVENGKNIIHADVTPDPGGDKTKSKETLHVYNAEMEPAQGNVRIAMHVNGHEIEIAGKSYTVKKAVEDSSQKDFADTDFDLQYIYVSEGLTSGSNTFIDAAAPGT